MSRYDVTYHRQPDTRALYVRRCGCAAPHELFENASAFRFEDAEPFIPYPDCHSVAIETALYPDRRAAGRILDCVVEKVSA